MKKLSELHKQLKKHLANLKQPVVTNKKKVTRVKIKDTHENIMWIDIKSTTIIKIVVLVVFLTYFWSLLGELSHILFILLVSMIFSAAISPIVTWFQKYKVPRWLSILLIYTILIGILFVILISLIPLFIDQMTSATNYLIGLVKNIQNDGIKAIPFIEYITPYVDEERLLITLQDSLDVIANNIGNFTGNILGPITSILTNVASLSGITFTVFVMTFFMVIDEKGFETFILKLIPRKHKRYVSEQGREIRYKLGAWLRGQLILNFVIAAIAFIFLSIIGVKYAFTIALITALTEFIPIIGPLIAAVPATLLALTQGFTMGLVVLICYILLNTIESNIIAPLIMKKSVGLHSMAVILAMLIGFTLMGPVGIILSIPLASIVMVIVNDYTSRNN